jgi:parallel beta-helix repeat protein
LPAARQKTARPFLILIWALLFTETFALAQGSLTPPGPPAPILKTLGQIEPRTPISALPYSITNSGSYYLTTNLTGASGIQILSNNVSLDLRGFTLAGTGGGDGIFINNATNIMVCNGIVTKWSTGLYAVFADKCRFEHLIFSQSFVGLSAGPTTATSDCTAAGNSGDGMVFENGSQIINCLSRTNGGYGFNAGSEVSVTGCVADFNGLDGINIDRGVVKDCLAEANAGSGISCFIGSLVANNKCLYNKVAGVTSGQGGNRFDGNDVYQNGFGVLLSGSTANLVTRNSASVNLTNYSIGAGNTVATVVPSSGIGTNLNPYANLTY